MHSLPFSSSFLFVFFKEYFFKDFFIIANFDLPITEWIPSPLNEKPLNTIQIRTRLQGHGPICPTGLARTNYKGPGPARFDTCLPWLFFLKPPVKIKISLFRRWGEIIVLMPFSLQRFSQWRCSLLIHSIFCNIYNQR